MGQSEPSLLRAAELCDRSFLSAGRGERDHRSSRNVHHVAVVPVDGTAGAALSLLSSFQAAQLALRAEQVAAGDRRAMSPAPRGGPAGACRALRGMAGSERDPESAAVLQNLETACVWSVWEGENCLCVL